MRQVVIGCGETGAPLATLLEERFGDAAQRHDPAKGWEAHGPFQVFHIFLPWSDQFTTIVSEYAAKWSQDFHKDQLFIIHSTVPVGTTRSLNLPAVHSPIRGMHHTMLQDLKTYVKFVGYDDSAISPLVAAAFEDLFHIKAFPDSRITELGKLLELCRYGMGIAFAREQAALCRGLGLPYEAVVTAMVHSHNEGMERRTTPGLRQQELLPPDGPIGGHCVLPGMRLVTEQFQPLLLSSAYQ